MEMKLIWYFSWMICVRVGFIELKKKMGIIFEYWRIQFSCATLMPQMRVHVIPV